MENNNIDLNTVDVNKTTALHIAARNGFQEIFRIIVEEIQEMPRDQNGSTPLHEAATNGENEIFQALMNKFQVRIWNAI